MLKAFRGRQDVVPAFRLPLRFIRRAACDHTRARFNEERGEHVVKYVIQRLIAAFFTFLAIIVVVFFVLHLMPGNIIDHSNKLDPAIRTLIEDKYHLNEPMIVQFGYAMRDYLRFDLGYSVKVNPGQPVFNIIASRLAVTVQLNYFSALVILPIGLLLGITMAIKKDSLYDNVASSLVILTISVPSFVLAALMQYLLGFKLGWFPLLLAPEEHLNWTKFYSMIMPILALSFGGIASIARTLRAELAEVLTMDFMQLAKAKGLSYGQTITRHALRNSCVPLASTFLYLFLGVLGSSLVIEQIFGVPGMSKIMLAAINGKDHWLTMGWIIFYTLIGLLMAILADLSYGIVDPRIRMGGGKDA